MKTTTPLLPPAQVPFGAPLEELASVARQLRYQAIQMSHRAGTPHLGSVLSCIDILVAAYWRVLRIDPAQPGAVLFEVVEPHIALVTINRPEARNAVNGAVASGLEAAVERIVNDPELWAAVLTGAGPHVPAAQTKRQAGLVRYRSSQRSPSAARLSARHSRSQASHPSTNASDTRRRRKSP